MSAPMAPANVEMLPEEAKLAPRTRRSMFSPSALLVPSMTETAVSSSAPALFAVTECTERQLLGMSLPVPSLPRPLPWRTAPVAATAAAALGAPRGLAQRELWHDGVHPGPSPDPSTNLHRQHRRTSNRREIHPLVQLRLPRVHRHDRDGEALRARTTAPATTPTTHTAPAPGAQRWATGSGSQLLPSPRHPRSRRTSARRCTSRRGSRLSNPEETPQPPWQQMSCKISP